MTKKEAREKAIQAILSDRQKYAGDKEMIHMMCDANIIQFLLNIGENDVAKAYQDAENTGFWYS